MTDIRRRGVPLAFLRVILQPCASGSNLSARRTHQSRDKLDTTEPEKTKPPEDVQLVKGLSDLARLEGLEPPAYWFEAKREIPGARGENRGLANLPSSVSKMVYSMNVSGSRLHRPMAGKVHQRERVQLLGPARDARVPDRVEREAFRPGLLDGSLVSLLQTRMIDVPAFGRCGK
jgi:hypothetical protein